MAACPRGTKTAKSQLSPHAALGGCLATALVVASCSMGQPAFWGTGAGADGGVAGSANGGGGGGGGAANPAVPSGRALRRLSQREYNNVVRDLLGDATQPASQWGNEVYTNGYDNGSGKLVVQSSDITNFQAAAEALAATAVKSALPKLIGTCDPTSNPTACVNAFMTGFAARAYRRPLTTAETTRLNTIYQAGAANGAGFTGGLQLMVEAVLQSPSFLYREELGARDPSLASGVVRLTDYEVASELSFLLTGSMPDDALFAAAASGKLKTPADIQAQATRLLASAAAKPELRTFLHEWMVTSQVGTVSKDTTIYPNFTPAVGASMVAELSSFYDQVLWSGTGSLRELFTSTQGYVDANLAPIYGVPAPGGAGLAPVTLDATTRQGILTRAGFLTAHADFDSSGPVVRGVFVLGQILCQPPPPPPPNIPPPPPASAGAQNKQTTRQQFQAHAGSALCASCHDQIDGIGFGVEEFDGVGAHRTQQYGVTVDTSGTVMGTDVDGPFVGTSQLASKLVTSKEVLSCFLGQVYSFAMGQEAPAGASNALLDAMGQGFTADSNIVGAFNAVVSNDAFVLRTTQDPNP